MKKKLTSFFISFKSNFFTVIKKERWLILIIIFLLYFLAPNYLLADSGNYLIKYKNIDLPQAVSFDSILAKDNFYKNSPNNQNIEYIEPNYKYNMAIVPSDTYYELQWYLKKIKAPQAWNEIRRGDDIVIAIVDSGVWINHPDLKDNIWINKKEIPGNLIDDDKNGFIDDVNGWDFVNNTSDPSPKFKPGYTQDGINHGTIIAGIAAAVGNNATGITGVAWRAKIMPLKVLDDHGEGDTGNVIRAVDYAIKNGADIINFSFVGEGDSRSLEAAIRRAYNAGIIIVAAAGNELSDGKGNFLDKNPMYPACNDGENNENMVIGVAATDALDQKAYFSSFGHDCVDISAPGVSAFSTTVYAPDRTNAENNFDKYYDGYWSGTSIATPMVSAGAALIQSVNPKLSRDELIGVLLNGADNISRLNPDYMGELGSGRLNLYNSVMSAKELLNKTKARLVISPYENRLSEIKIASADGKEDSKFFAYNKNFRGGVNVAVGDVDGDGSEEIITGAGFTGGPHVRIFDADGNLKGQFFAYNKNFRGGVNVAVGDIDGDGREEIITGAGFTGGPQVRIFNGQGTVKGQFFAYDSKFRGGVKVAVADINNKVRNTNSKIITSPGRGGGPQIRLFDNHGQIINQFFAFQKKFHGGVSVSAGDIDNDGLDEVIACAGPGGSPHIRIFDKYGTLLKSFYAYEADFSGGVKASVINLKN